MAAVSEFQINTPESLKSATALGYWRSFFEGLGTTVWVWDIDSDSVDFTPRWLESLGYPANDIQTGTQWFALLHPDDTDAVTKQTHACVNGEIQGLDLEFRLRRADGLYNWVHSRAQIVEIGDDNPSRHFLGLYTDTSKRHADELQLSEQEARWNRALEGTNLGVWEWNIESGEVYWSPEFLRVLKLDDTDLVRRLDTWLERIVDEDKERNQQLLEEYLRGEISEYCDEHRVKCGDGKIIWVSTKGEISARSAGGEPLRMVGTIDDISKRKHEQRNLQQVHERFQRVTATMPGFVYEYHLRPDGSDCFPFASDGIESIYGISAESVKHDASRVLQAIHPDDREAVGSAIAVSAKQGKQWSSRYRIIDSHGEVRWVSGVANPRETLEPNGARVWHGAITDITDEVAHEHRLAHTTQVIPGALYQYKRWPDGHHSFPFSTGQILPIFGSAPERLAANADCFWEIIHPEDVERVRAFFAESVENQVGWDEEYRVTISGAVVWVRSVANFVDSVTTDGSLLWFGYASDITKIKERELSALKQNDLIKQVMATVPGMICQYVIDPHGNASVPFVSQGVDAIHGVSMTAARTDAASLWTYIHPDDKSRLADIVAKPNDFDVEYRVLLPKIGEQWRRALATCLCDVDGSRIYYAYVMDVTERNANELALAEQANAIALSNEDLEQFNYIAAHDLKEPLRAIRHLTEWIEEDLPPAVPESVTQNLSRLRDRVDRLQALVEDLAVYSRAGRQGQESRRLDIRDVVVRAASDADHLACNIDYTAVDSVEFETVEVALATVFRNLINNAAAHHDNPKEGCVKVSAQLEKGFIACSVEDDGPGIPIEHHERVFKMYQRLNPEANPSGTGSGLAIVRRIIGAAHGTIGLQSPLTDRGTRFTFKWPLRWPRAIF